MGCTGEEGNQNGERTPVRMKACGGEEGNQNGEANDQQSLRKGRMEEDE